jgi:F-type H+-transporting ATPase subunit b
MTTRWIGKSVPVLLLFCVLGFVIAPPAARAQQESNGPANPSLTPGQELTKESREAAGEGGAEEFKHSAPVRWISRNTGLSLETSYVLAMSVNFIAMAVLIVWLYKKNVPAMFRVRTAAIQKSLEEARQASADANHRLAEIEARLAKLDAEIGEMRAAAEKEAAAEEQRIKASAEEDARKIVDSIGQEITAAVKTARRDLTTYAADLAVSLARKQIHVDAKVDQNIVQYFARQLSNGDKPKDA